VDFLGPNGYGEDGGQPSAVGRRRKEVAVTLNSVVNRFVRHLGDFLAEFDFERRGRAFRRFSPQGDTVVIDLQTSSVSDKQSRLFYVNIGFVLHSHWMWLTRGEAQEGQLPRSSHGTWWQRIGFTNFADARWEVRDEEAAAATLERLKSRLRETVPDVVRMLDRDELRRLVDQEVYLGGSMWATRNWLLAEEGRAEELRKILFPNSPEPSPTSEVHSWMWQMALRNAARRPGPR
jgi:Domain of unknown function (DUF4304)